MFLKLNGFDLQREVRADEVLLLRKDQITAVILKKAHDGKMAVVTAGAKSYFVEYDDTVRQFIHSIAAGEDFPPAEWFQQESESDRNVSLRNDSDPQTTPLKTKEYYDARVYGGV